MRRQANFEVNCHVLHNDCRLQSKLLVEGREIWEIYAEGYPLEDFCRAELNTLLIKWVAKLETDGDAQLDILRILRLTGSYSISGQPYLNQDALF